SADLTVDNLDDLHPLTAGGCRSHRHQNAGAQQHSDGPQASRAHDRKPTNKTTSRDRCSMTLKTTIRLSDPYTTGSAPRSVSVLPPAMTTPALTNKGSFDPGRDLAATTFQPFVWKYPPWRWTRSIAPPKPRPPRQGRPTAALGGAGS